MVGNVHTRLLPLFKVLRNLGLVMIKLGQSKFLFVDYACVEMAGGHKSYCT